MPRRPGWSWPKTPKHKDQVAGRFRVMSAPTQQGELGCNWDGVVQPEILGGHSVSMNEASTCATTGRSS
jgi:hypothetical protein